LVAKNTISTCSLAVAMLPPRYRSPRPSTPTVDDGLPRCPLAVLWMLSKNTQCHEQNVEALHPSPSRRTRPPARRAAARRFIQAVAGPRQAGKSTLVAQELDGAPHRYASADEPTLKDATWIEQQWQAARVLAGDSGSAILALDEIQKDPGWSETVKRLWDEDGRRRLPLKVVLLGSAPLLMAHGLTESLAGRFELLHLPHWSYAEMRDAFGWTPEQRGGAPDRRAAALGALRARRAGGDFHLARRAAAHPRRQTGTAAQTVRTGLQLSGQVLSFTKMLGQLQDAGNTTTLAHYLDLLAAAGMVTGLAKYAGDAARGRASSPKLQVLNTALMTAGSGLTLAETRAEPALWGRLVESAVGAHLANAAAGGRCGLFYWRDRGVEVDFVARAGRRLVAIEVKSGRRRELPAGIAAFQAAFKPQRTLLVGGDGIPVEEFLERPVDQWLQP
jgi:predicted AAA+ superfamily ATPase